MVGGSGALLLWIGEREAEDDDPWEGLVYDTPSFLCLLFRFYTTQLAFYWRCMVQCFTHFCRNEMRLVHDNSPYASITMFMQDVME